MHGVKVLMIVLQGRLVYCLVLGNQFPMLEETFAWGVHSLGRWPALNIANPTPRSTIVGYHHAPSVMIQGDLASSEGESKFKSIHGWVEA